FRIWEYTLYKYTATRMVVYDIGPIALGNEQVKLHLCAVFWLYIAIFLFALTGVLFKVFPHDTLNFYYAIFAHKAIWGTNSPAIEFISGFDKAYFSNLDF